MSGSRKGSANRRNPPKLFLVQGIRHSAVVVAGNKDEALELAANDSDCGASDTRVLYGGVQRWEAPEAIELKLPEGFRLELKPTRGSLRRRTPSR